MIVRVGVIAAVLGLAAFALWHPAASPIAQSGATTPAPAASFAGDAGNRTRHRGRRAGFAGDALVVYVAGAVERPGLYRLHPGDRYAQAVAMAGGMQASADAAGVNLAQHAQDGDEIDVPAIGEAPRRGATRRHGRKRSARPPGGAIDVNRSDAQALAAVPGIGAAIAQRIVELRRREGPFASLDELLDVAGMTQTRLDRARPYLRQP